MKYGELGKDWRLDWFFFLFFINRLNDTRVVIECLKKRLVKKIKPAKHFGKPR